MSDEHEQVSPEGTYVPGYQPEGNKPTQQAGCSKHGYDEARFTENVDLTRHVLDVQSNGVPLLEGYYETGDFFIGGYFYCLECGEEWEASYDVE